MNKTGFIVDFRVVMESHDHRGIKVFVPYEDRENLAPVTTPEQAEKVAYKQIANVRLATGTIRAEKVFVVGIETKEEANAKS